MFNKCELRSRMQLPEVYFIHERSNEKDAASGSAEQIFRGEGIGQHGGVQPDALIGDSDDEIRAGVFKSCCDAFTRVIGVAMQDRIHGSFSHGHANAKSLILIDARLAGHLFGGLFDFIDAVERGFQRVCNAGFFLSPQVALPRFLHGLSL